MKSLLPALGAIVLVGSGVSVLSAASAWADDVPTCNGKAATIVVPAGQTTPVDGTAGDDIFYVAGSADVNALAGNDTICGDGGGTGQWDGGEGDDWISGNPSALVGGPGNDVLRGGNGDNSVLGGAGSDEIWGGGGADRLTGGAGDDVMHASARDTIDVGGPTVTTIDATARTITGPDGNDRYAGSPAISASGLDSDEVFFGSDRADVFNGGRGHDRIYGRGGNDTLAAQQPALMDGGPGDDQLTVSFGGTVKGGSGNDLIRTVMLYGDTEPAAVTPFKIDGSGGNDVIYASSYGRTSPSVPTDPADRWTGAVRGGLGRDQIIFSAAVFPVTADLSTGKATWAAGEMTMAGVQDLWGTKGDDVLIGNSQANWLTGGRGDDKLVGNGGNDNLSGSSGFDTGDGGSGRDRCATQVKSACER